MRRTHLLFPTLILIASAGLSCSSSGGGGTGGETIGLCEAAQNWEAWVGLEGDNKVTVINGPRFAARMNIDLTATGLNGPHQSAFYTTVDPTKANLGKIDGTAFVAFRGTQAMNYADAGVAIVALKGNTKTVGAAVHTNEEIVAIGARPDNGSQAWAISKNGTLFVIDAAGGTVTASVTFGTGDPASIAFSPDGATAYVANARDNAGKSSVTVFDVASHSETGSYETDAGTSDLAISADGDTMWVANKTAGTVQKIDLTASDKTMAVSMFAMGLTNVHAIAVAKHVIAVADGKTTFFSSMGAVVKEVELTATRIAVSPECGHHYLYDEGGKVFQEIDAALNKRSATVNVMGNTPHGLALRPTAPDM